LTRDIRPAPVVAILRFDFFLDGHTAPESCVTVKGLVRTWEEAEREVDRLNALITDGKALYFAQHARWLRDDEPA
jgi:hypothetical protein